MSSMNPLHLIFTSYAEKYGLTIQSERSFKLHTRQIETGTLYAFDPLELPSPDQLFELTSLLGFNETTNLSIAKNLSEANLIGISIPDQEKTTGCNFYLEFWDKVCQTVRSPNYRDEALLMYLGYKLKTNKNTIVDNYYCQPLITPTEITNRIGQLYTSPEDQTLLNLIQKLILEASTMISNRDSFIYLEVENENSGRRSFDVNLYKADLDFNRTNDPISQILKEFELAPDSLERLDEQNTLGPLGHISGGINYKGEPFLSIYFETTQ